MLVLPIKKKWYDMLLSGEKKEEYRELKPYYTKRFLTAVQEYQIQKLNNGECEAKAWIECVEQDLGSSKNINSDYFIDCVRKHSLKMYVIIKNGYRKDSPSFASMVELTIGEGKPEWGAVPNEEYYVLKIKTIGAAE